MSDNQAERGVTTETTTAAAAPAGTSGLLDQILSATKQTERDRAAELVRALVEQAQAKTVRFDKNLTRTIEQAVAEIDRRLSAQVNEIMHNQRFLKLEASWRGLHYLVSNSQSIPSLRIRVLNAGKRELARNLSRSVEFDQSHLWKAIYESGFGQAGGEPFAGLIGDYEWDAGQDDVETLQLLSGVAGAAFAPFISAPAPSMFGFSSWTELNKPRDLSKIFDTSEYTKWRAFRDSDDSRYVSLAMPRVLARRPYGRGGAMVDEFAYEEAPIATDGSTLELEHDKYCWMNAAYALGTKLTAAFADYGFCTAIRGAEHGRIENLPLHNFLSDEGDRDDKCPTEVNIPDRREAELSRLGFLPLVHYKNTDYAVFFSAQTAQKPKKYDRDDDNANAEISARLPYVMATGRFAHYLKVMARDKIGSFMEASNCENWLNRWIMQYVNGNPEVSEELKARYPLREARVEVREVAGQPGVYDAVALMRPWLQMEELTASLRMVARIPKATPRT
jgi:type VI secretion system protein ImpC